MGGIGSGAGGSEARSRGLQGHASKHGGHDPLSGPRSPCTSTRPCPCPPTFARCGSLWGHPKPQCGHDWVGLKAPARSPALALAPWPGAWRRGQTRPPSLPCRRPPPRCGVPSHLGQAHGDADEAAAETVGPAEVPQEEGLCHGRQVVYHVLRHVGRPVRQHACGGGPRRRAGWWWREVVVHHETLAAIRAARQHACGGGPRRRKGRMGGWGEFGGCLSCRGPCGRMGYVELWGSWVVWLKKCWDGAYGLGWSMGSMV